MRLKKNIPFDITRLFDSGEITQDRFGIIRIFVCAVFCEDGGNTGSPQLSVQV